MKTTTDPRIYEKAMQEILGLQHIQDEMELQKAIKEKLNALGEVRKIIVNYKLASKIKELNAEAKPPVLKTVVVIVMSFLYACLCVLGFRLFLMYEMNIVLQIILVNLSAIWGIMSVRGFVNIFKGKFKT